MNYAIMIKTVRGYENVNTKEKLVGCVFSKIWIAGIPPIKLAAEIKLRAQANDAQVIYVS